MTRALSKVVGHGPAHDALAECVQHDRQVQPPAPRPDVGDVRDPEAIGLVSGEGSRYQIGRRCRVLVANRRPQSAAAMLAVQARMAHQPGHPLAATAHAHLAEFDMDAGRAIGPSALRVDGTDARQQGLIRLGPG
jgi:hypothetical protein